MIQIALEDVVFKGHSPTRLRYSFQPLGLKYETPIFARYLGSSTFHVRDINLVLYFRVSPTIPE